MATKRSPDKSSSWISKQIAIFGRYSDRRPEGLYVSEDGTMVLNILMRSWAHEHGLDEAVVLTACKEHMYHDDLNADGSKRLRFVIAADQSGQTTIRVMPKRGGDGVATPARSHRRQAGEGGEPPAERTVVEKMEMSLDELVREQRSRGEVMASTGGTGSTPRTCMTSHQVGSAQNDFDEEILEVASSQSGDGGGSSSSEDSDREGLPPRKPVKSANNEARFARVRRATQQMGLTPATQHVRSAPKGSVGTALKGSAGTTPKGSVGRAWKGVATPVVTERAIVSVGNAGSGPVRHPWHDAKAARAAGKGGRLAHKGTVFQHYYYYNNRGPARSRSRGKAGGKWRSDAGKTSCPKPPEGAWRPFSTWLSYMLRQGYQEHGVPMRGPWAQMTALAEVAQVRPNMKVWNEASFLTMCRNYDVEGRFEIKGNWVRKVPKEERGFGSLGNGGSSAEKGGQAIGCTPRTSRRAIRDVEPAPVQTPPPMKALPAPPVEMLWRDRAGSPSAGSPRRRSRSCSISSVASKASKASRSVVPEAADAAVDMDADAVLASACDKALHVDDDKAIPSAEEIKQMEEPEPAVIMPSGPPGEHWATYNDEAQGVWWYYEGPLGKFFTMGTNEPVQVFRDAMEEG